MPVMSMYKHNRNIPVTTWLNIKVLKLKLPSPCQWWRYMYKHNKNIGVTTWLNMTVLKLKLHSPGQ